MNRERWGARDLTYSAGHRGELVELYPRIGHRLNTCDRDWTEYCFACREPLAIVEEYRIVGHNLRDKATTVTRNLARRAGLPAYVMGWQADRPDDVQDRIDELNRQVRHLEGLHPIVEVHARRLTPTTSPWEVLTPEQWWEAIKIMHGEHYLQCGDAQRLGPRVTPHRLHELQADHPLWPQPHGSRILALGWRP